MGSAQLRAASGDTIDQVKPLYKRVKEALLRRVLSGEWRPGEIIPSEMALAREYEVSLGTARKAIEELATEKLVVRQRGRGTMIARNNERYEPFRFYRLVVDVGGRPNFSTHYLSCTTQPAEEDDAENLDIAVGEPTIKIERVRSHEGTPAVLELITIREDRVKGAGAIIDNLKPACIYSALERAYHIIFSRTQERVQLHYATARDAEVLGVATGSAVLEVIRCAYALDGELVEYRRMHALPSLHYANEVGGAA